MPAPNANERHCGGISLPNAPITTVNDDPASPKPSTMPAERYIIPGVLEYDMAARPSAYSTAPTLSTGAAP